MSEKFILNTVFKHEIKPIDEQAMRDYLAFIKEELAPTFRISSHVHRSPNITTSLTQQSLKEVFLFRSKGFCHRNVLQFSYRAAGGYIDSARSALGLFRGLSSVANRNNV